MESDEMKDSVILYANKLEPLEDLTIEERGIILTAIMAYMVGGEVPEMDRTVKMAWRYIDAQLKLDSEKYEETIRAARSESGKKGAAARWGKDGKNMANEWQTDGKMAKMAVHVHDHVPDHDHVPEPVHDPVPDPVPTPGDGKPTAGEVEEYAASLGYPGFVGKVFIDYYEERGWKINGEPIRDWRALMRKWLQHEDKGPKVTSADVARKNNKFKNFDERTDDLDDEVARKYREQIAKWRQNNEDQP